MPPKRRARSVARYAKQVPGYRFARRSLLPRVRASTTVRGLAKRVFEIDPDQPRIVDVAPGNLLGGVGTERLPVVAIVALEVHPETIPDLVDEVARFQLLTAGFRPVFVLDSPEFGPVRRYGYVAELLVSEAAWPHHHVRWHDYRDQRLNTIVQRYGTSATVTVGHDGLDDAGRTILRALAPLPV